MVLSANTYYQGDSAITAMYQGDTLVYSAIPITTVFYYTTTGGTKVPDEKINQNYSIVSNTYSGGVGRLELRGRVNYLYSESFGYGNAAVESVILPDTIEYIQIRAFAQLPNLLSVTISPGIRNIAQDVFFGSNSITEITFLGTIAQWESINKSPWWNDEAPHLSVVHCSDGDVSVDYPPGD